MWLVLLKDSDEDEVFEIVSAENEDDAYEQAEKLNKGAKATGIKLLIDETGKNTMFKRGGKVKGKTKYTYLPQHEIAYITTWDGVIIDAEDILDGAYIRGRRKFEEGGSVWAGSSEGVEGAGMFAKGGSFPRNKPVKLNNKNLESTINSYFYEWDKSELKKQPFFKFSVGKESDGGHYIEFLRDKYYYQDNVEQRDSDARKIKLFAKGGSITENPYEYAKDKAQGLVSKAKEVSGFAKGGRVKRSKGNSPSGRAWTLDHYQHNKSEKYEVPMRNRKHKR